MKLKKVVVSVLLLAMLLSVFVSVSVKAVAEDVPQEAALAYTYEAEAAEESAQSSVGLWFVVGCTLLLAVAGVVSINCQKIYDSEK